MSLAFCVGRKFAIALLLLSVGVAASCLSCMSASPPPETAADDYADVCLNCSPIYPNEAESYEGAPPRVIIEESSILFLDETTGTGSGHGTGSGRAHRRSNSDPLSGVGPAAGDGDGQTDDTTTGERQTVDQSDDVSPLSLVDQVLAKLDLGNLAFNTPEAMEFGTTETVELLLSTKETTTQLAEAVEGRPVETAEGVRVAPEMEATLTGQGFTIEAVTPTKQAVSTLQRTRWAWTLIPTKEGPQRLDLSLSARIKVEGKDSPFVVKTFTRSIEVQVDPVDRILGLFKEHWNWLWTTLLLPLGVWLRKRWRKPPETTPPDDATS